MGESLPLDASLRDLGTHRLKDLEGTEQVWQLCHPGLEVDFPPLLSLDVIRHNLPVQLTTFVGREQEVKELIRLLPENHLLTLTGAAGCGKTRLALEVAAQVLDAYPDGVWLAELAPLADPDLVLQAVAGALHVKEEPGRPLIETMAHQLAGLPWRLCPHPGGLRAVRGALRPESGRRASFAGPPGGELRDLGPGDVGAGLAKPGRALRLEASVHAFWKTLGVAQLSVPFWDVLLEKWLGQTRTELGPEAAAAAWDEGAQMSFEEAVAYALREAPESLQS